MFNKMIYFAITFSVVVGFRNSAVAMDIRDAEGFEPNHKAPSLYAQTHTRIVDPASAITEKTNQVSQKEKYKGLEEKLKDLMEELKRLEKEMENKFIKEILPRIKREIEKLKKRLREFQFDDDEPKPVEV